MRTVGKGQRRSMERRGLVVTDDERKAIGDRRWWQCRGHWLVGIEGTEGREKGSQDWEWGGPNQLKPGQRDFTIR